MKTAWFVFQIDKHFQQKNYVLALMFVSFTGGVSWEDELDYQLFICPFIFELIIGYHYD